MALTAQALSIFTVSWFAADCGDETSPPLGFGTPAGYWSEIPFGLPEVSAALRPPAYYFLTTLRVGRIHAALGFVAA
ncbi:hypothetical protein SBV1_920012 [Verrucomicrobia bacterium]|nr:hypothetical protein SBV1_920012 [Verrucomicrobiota bacterium]